MTQEECNAIWSAVKDYIEAEAEVLFMRQIDAEPDAAVGNRYAKSAEVLRERMRKAAGARANERRGIG